MSGMNLKTRIQTVAALALVWAAFHICLSVSAIPSRPSPQRLVNDLAGLFSEEQEMRLEQMLVAFDDTTSNQIAVVTVPELEGYTASEYATRIGIDWGVGSGKFDNGIVVLIKPKTELSMGEVFIAVGYGLEGAITDSYAKRIIENNMIPHFIEGDYYGGAEEACILLMKLASGEISEMRDDDDEAWIAFLVMFIIIIVVAVIIANGSSGNGKGNGGRGRTIYTGPVITRGGGWHSGGGSFGGGSFGGFGGGSFGGGGAGGRF